MHSSLSVFVKASFQHRLPTGRWKGLLGTLFGLYPPRQVEELLQGSLSTTLDATRCFKARREEKQRQHQVHPPQPLLIRCFKTRFAECNWRPNLLEVAWPFKRSLHSISSTRALDKSKHPGSLRSRIPAAGAPGRQGWGRHLHFPLISIPTSPRDGLRGTGTDPRL